MNTIHVMDVACVFMISDAKGDRNGMCQET